MSIKLLLFRVMHHCASVQTIWYSLAKVLILKVVWKKAARGILQIWHGVGGKKDEGENEVCAVYMSSFFRILASWWQFWSTLCHSFLSDKAAVYQSDLLRVYSPSRQLRSSSDSRTPRIPHIKTKTFGHRLFSHAAPSVWMEFSASWNKIYSVNHCI